MSLAPPASGRLRKRSVRLAGHPTSLSVEQIFWDELKELAAEEGISLQKLIERLDQARFSEGDANISLSGAVRVHVVERLRQKLRKVG
ncbi:MAG TPA: ribbon-helix-helix domain-containing protein [Kiloniellales bacterium]|nr:ribbon-helix-helix domain-containing protein [Kiloniellales bacterium]